MLDEIKQPDLFRLTSPHSYVLVVTVDKTGQPNAMGVSWWTFCSMDPLRVAFAIGKRKYTHEILSTNPEAILVFPADDQAKEAWLCGTASGRDRNKFDECAFEVCMAHETRIPLIGGCTAAIEARVTQRVDAGSHTLFVADVLAMHGDDSRPFHLYAKGYRELYALDADAERRAVKS